MPQLAAGFYRRVGLAAWPLVVADGARDPAPYVDAALALATNGSLRAETSAALSARRGALFEAPEVIDEWRAFLLRAAASAA